MKYERTNYWLLIFIQILMYFSIVLASEDNNADGKLVVNSEVIRLKYAYAIAQEGFFNKSKEDILVVISDVPLKKDEIEDSFERKRMMQEGKLHCVEIIIDANRNPISVTILHNAFNAPPSGRGYEVFEAKTFDTKVIEGRIYTSKENEFFDTKYEYNASFRATIRREVPPTSTEKEAATKSPQATAYRQYEQAIKESDIEALKNLVTHEILEEMSADEVEEAFEFMQMSMPKNVKFMRVMVNGHEATLEMSAEEDGQNITGKVHLLLDGKQWKVGENNWNY